MTSFDVKSIEMSHFQGRIIRDASLKSMTSWHIGGTADWLITVDDIHSLVYLISLLTTQQNPYLLFGSGTNILFSDLGFRGVLIQLGTGFKAIEIKDNFITAGAASTMRAIGMKAAASGLTGFEELTGIPGTAGAAAAINAGAHGVNFLDRTREITGVIPPGNLFSTHDIDSQYRHHSLPEKLVITQIILELERGDSVDVMEKVNRYLEKRAKTQPLDQYSAGCTFKNPLGTGAGRLIDQAGLKGFRIGDAMVSELHANFMINLGTATAEQMIRLMLHVKKAIYDQFQVQLESEVMILDEHGNNIDLEAVI